MTISGEEAKNYNAVRLDSMANANQGELVAADEDTGFVVYKDRTGEEVKLQLAPHSIRILRR
jgi:hypothetical protein